MLLVFFQIQCTHGYPASFPWTPAWEPENHFTRQLLALRFLIAYGVSVLFTFSVTALKFYSFCSFVYLQGTNLVWAANFFWSAKNIAQNKCNYR